MPRWLEIALRSAESYSMHRSCAQLRGRSCFELPKIRLIDRPTDQPAGRSSDVPSNDSAAVIEVSSGRHEYFKLKS